MIFGEVVKGEANLTIKLVIWDLDDTLWHGTLAEGETVTLHAERAEMIRVLNRCGIVSAICSKNDAATAERTLKTLGMWDEFVFPRIAFVPKGEAVKQLIEDMQLRPANVLFIDDNEMNLREVKALLPDIQTANSTLPEADVLLTCILDDNKHITHSRVEEYRSLQARVGDRAGHGGSNEEFLRSCDIRVTLVAEQDNLVFRQRIVDLVNRSNQMNFTHSRIDDPDAFFEMLQDRRRYTSISVFVRDRYGSHGLVGFLMIDQPNTLMHFVFSCRVMHMGVEQWLLARMQKLARIGDRALPEITRRQVDWIGEELFLDPMVRAAIMKNHAEVENTGAPRMRIMFDCQSAATAHFTGLGSLVEFDNAPRVFELWRVLEWGHINQSWPELLVYGAFSDYSGTRWRTPIYKYDFYSFSVAAERLCSFIRERGCKMLVMLAPENVAPEKYLGPFGCPYEEVLRFNDLWRRLGGGFPELTIFELSSIANDDNVDDIRHYKTSMLKQIAEVSREWALAQDPDLLGGNNDAVESKARAVG